MKIVILEGSPNQKGSSNMLADCFKQGAEEAGHTVVVIDAAHADIHPCTGCVHCGYEGPCVQKDEVESIRKKILNADMIEEVIHMDVNSLLRLTPYIRSGATVISAMRRRPGISGTHPDRWKKRWRIPLCGLHR